MSLEMFVGLTDELVDCPIDVPKATPIETGCHLHGFPGARETCLVPSDDKAIAAVSVHNRFRLKRRAWDHDDGTAALNRLAACRWPLDRKSVV
jgi:hypothetical protein